MDSRFRANLKAIAQANKNYTDSEVATLQNQLDVANAKITNLENSASGNIYTETTLSGTANVVTLNANTLPYGTLNKWGGMSIKCNNICHYEGTNKYYLSWDGTNDAANGTLFTAYPTSAGKVFYISTNTSVKNISISFFDKDQEYISRSVAQNTTQLQATAPENAAYAFCWFNYNASDVVTSDIVDSLEIMGNVGLGFIDYEPYFTGLRHSAVTNVDVVGKNLFDKTQSVVGAMAISNGALIAGATTYNSSDYIEINTNSETLYLTDLLYSSSNYGCAFYDSDKTFISGLGTMRSVSFTIPNNAKYFRFSWQSALISSDDIMLSYSNNTTYTPYVAPITKIIPAEIQALDGYGMGISQSVCNYVGVANKKFRKNVGIVDLGTLSWAYRSTEEKFKAYISDMAGASTLLCSNYTYGNNSGYDAQTMTDMTINSHNASNVIYIKDTNYTTAEAFKTAMSGVYLVYELTEPTETDITDSIGEMGLLDDKYLSGLEGNGIITLTNEYDIAVPYDITTYVKAV